MQQDSMVLTYLEGLLMHQAAVGSSTVVENGSSVRPTDDQKLKLPGNMFPNCHNNGSVLNSPAYQGSGLLHLKKARLLQSSEDWNAAKKRRLSDPSVELNGKNEAVSTGMADNVPKGKQDSTLLASLLQSFSSRLQTVALSQQIRQSLKDQGYSHDQEPLEKEKDSQCYGVASSHLKTLLKKNKAKDAKTNPTGVQQNHNDRIIESPKPGQSATNGVTEALSCAARLQAVASMVEKRSSPAASPKPSVACSQLALLLSSEAHLQRYSQEHAMKAQNASQLASEKLAAMARLQETCQQDLSPFQLSNKTFNLHSQSRTPPKTLNNANNSTLYQSPVGIPSSPPKMANCKHPSERHNSKPSLNNSLLLHLLKSQNAIQKSKNYKQTESGTVYENSSTPTTADEFSDNNPSFTEEDSSDEESSHSNCVPIDLSFKRKHSIVQSPSLDNLTQSFLQNWNPKVNVIENNRANNDSSESSSLKPHQKVTLLQLLLGHKSDDNPEKNPDIHRPKNMVDLAKTNAPTGIYIPSCDDTHSNQITPLSTPPLFHCAKADSPINLSHQSLTIKSKSPSYICNSQPERPVNPASKHLMDLSKSKETKTPTATSEINQNSATFSASKLLQNLAQCGKQTSPSVDELKTCKNLLNGNAEKTVGLSERVSSPLLQNRAAVIEENKRLSSPPTPADPGLSGSEIENLLERRTVLQLLLGTTSKNNTEKKCDKIPNHDHQQHPSEKGLNGHIPAVKIKTEPPEEDSNTGNNSHVYQVSEKKSNKCVGICHTVVKSPDTLPIPDTFKQEPPSTQNFSFSRNGLLSRLLRQNHDDYPIDDLDTNQKNGELSPMKSLNHCTIPKKRKVPHIEPSESPIKRIKRTVSESASRHISPSDGSYGTLLHQQEINGMGTDLDLKYNHVHSPQNDSESRSWSRESKGFNVLKQLLLSENCIRDMSHHRNNIPKDGWINGNKPNTTNKPDYSTSPMNALVGTRASQTNCIDYRTRPYPSAVNSPSHSFPEHFGNVVPRPEIGQFKATPADKGPLRWVITGMEKGEFGRDSPRLTKTNPILYYMLQRGGHMASTQEEWGRNGWCESSVTDNATRVAFKGDADTGATSGFLNLQNSYNHMRNAASLHNGSGNNFRISEKVHKIKKEPE
ncbi:hypothetical protein NDU88_007621 [Pleurodeles waltl]|uniref:Nuclear receptor-interacting protein 1 n=1 Tax=Pleurodeles waltl TaxID=8319 RepID=A0AAV7P2P4_PLEWA|nr:hypothetical protein NDU88_007621 [Pleurodeles waltl]